MYFETCMTFFFVHGSQKKLKRFRCSFSVYFKSMGEAEAKECATFIVLLTNPLKFG